MRQKVTCPFCEGDGCCFCDHEGTIFVGPNELIKSEAGLDSVGVRYLEEADKESELEPWPEMFALFLDETRTPDEINRGLNQKLREQLISNRAGGFPVAPINENVFKV